MNYHSTLEIKTVQVNSKPETTQTSGLKLVVLFGLQNRMRDPQPGVVLPQLRNQVVGHEPHRPRQSVQHDGHEGLRVSWRRGDLVRKGKKTKTMQNNKILKHKTSAKLTFRERNTVLAVMAKVRM